MNSLYLFICVYVSFVCPSNLNSLHELWKYGMQDLWCVTPHFHTCTPNVKRTVKVGKPWWTFPKDQLHQPKSMPSLFLLLIDHYSFETQSISLDRRSQPSPGWDLTRALNPMDSNSSHYRQHNRGWAYCFNHLAIHLSIPYSLPDSLYLTLMAWELKLFYNEGFPTAYSPHYAHKHTDTYR